MVKSSSTQEKGNKFDTIVTIVFVIIVVFATVYVATAYLFPGETEKKYTSSYKSIDVEAAYNLINKTKNLVIIDCRGLEGCGSCQIKSEGRLDFDFVYLNQNPYVHFNTTENLLIYSKDGIVAQEDFCKILVNHVYGKIYNLEGGYNAWKDAGYPISKIVPPEYPGEVLSLF